MRRASPLVIAVACAAGLAWARGCGSQEDASPSGGGTAAGDSGTGASGGSTGGKGGSASGGTGGTGASGGCPSSGLPVNVPDGWEQFTGYPCDCTLYVPGKNGSPPEPVTWEPCPSPGPDNPTCKRMATPWTTTTSLSIAAAVTFWYDSVKAKSFLEFRRIFVGDDENVRYTVIADLDGPVLTSYLQVSPANTQCELLIGGQRQGQYAFAVTPGKFIVGKPEGVLAGQVGAATAVAFEHTIEPVGFTSWYVSSDWLVSGRVQILARPWDLSAEHVVYDPSQDPEHLPAHNVQPWGNAVFFEVTAGSTFGVMSWTLADGLRPLLRWPGVATKGASNFNTDGVDMVWTYGEGVPSQGDFPVRSMMTAPFTTDPAVVATTAKRLRSDPSSLASVPLGMGCGYAGTIVYVPATPDGGAETNALLVVRLSDGVSWMAMGPPMSTNMHYAGVLGMSCTEVFALAQFPDDAVSVVRIRLDSLGAAIPPD